MLRAGRLGQPPVTAAALRVRGGQRLRPRIDAKAVVTLAAAVLLIVVLFTLDPLGHPAHRTSAAPAAIPPGWTAHSAYGIQLAAPNTWSVQVFGQCPDGKRPGTLFIGTSRFNEFCPEYGSGTGQVDVFPDTGGGPDVTPGTLHRMQVHGLSVLSSETGTELRWTIPSLHLTVTGMGPGALSIMRTLARATGQAVPATGEITGAEYLDAMARAPVSGPMTVRSLPSGRSTQVAVVGGVFSFSGSPGRYVLTGHDGNAPCGPVTVTLVSGTITAAPPIVCQGE
jgi:hypothetical protein